MTLRPIPAQWFELVTTHNELAPVMECLSRTGVVELEARSSATNQLLFPALAEELRSHREFARRYQNYWPAAVSTAKRQPEQLEATLKSARQRLTVWAEQADPVIAAIERGTQEATDLTQLQAALQSAGPNLPDLKLLVTAGPRLQVRLLLLPAGVFPREMPTLVLFKSWQTPAAKYILVVGRRADIGEVEAQLPGLKARAVPLPSWLPSASQDAVAKIAERLAGIIKQREQLEAQLVELSERQTIAGALGDIALIEWLNEHAKDLRGSERLAWVTGWTSDVTGAELGRALKTCGVRYVLRLAEAPAGTIAPLVLSNPSWARAFEVFARMLGTPGRYESDPSQILAVIASVIFGFMFGDMGQGLIVLIVGFAFGRRVPLTRMLVPGGIMAMVFGVLFGSVFCREDIVPALWMRPLADPITVLIVAVIAGVAIISIGMLLDAVQMHWRGQALRWWGQRAGLFAAYAGLLVSPLRLEGLTVAGLGALWYLVGSLIFVEEGRLAAIATAAAEFVEQTLRLLVNTISFARIGAFALAHAGLSLAIIDMATASGRIGYWIVLVIGNVLVIALEGVVVSIQATRLLLFEFFIRFLTGVGREFKPLPPPNVATA